MMVITFNTAFGKIDGGIIGWVDPQTELIGVYIY